MFPQTFDPTMAAIWFVAFLFSVVCHEAAHAWAARAGGDNTAYANGQVTLNPMPHIRQEPAGLVLFPIVSFLMKGYMIGWGSAPYDPHWAIRYPKRAAWMAFAGPAANLTIALISVCLIHAGITAGIFERVYGGSIEDLIGGTTTLWGAPATLLSILFFLNCMLFVFNMLPLPPLDGIGVLGLFTSEEVAMKLRSLKYDQNNNMIGMLISWFVFPYVWRAVFPFILMAIL